MHYANQDITLEEHRVRRARMMAFLHALTFGCMKAKWTAIKTMPMKKLLLQWVVCLAVYVVLYRLGLLYNFLFIFFLISLNMTLLAALFAQYVLPFLEQRVFLSDSWLTGFFYFSYAPVSSQELTVSAEHASEAPISDSNRDSGPEPAESSAFIQEIVS